MYLEVNVYVLIEAALNIQVVLTFFRRKKTDNKSYRLYSNGKS